MVESSGFSDLIRHCEWLIALLRDPHPGLMTWQEQVQQARRFIWDYSTTSQEALEAFNAIPIVGGWCQTCGEPVVMREGTTECPTSDHGWRRHDFTKNAELTEQYPVSLPVRVTMVK